MYLIFNILHVVLITKKIAQQFASTIVPVEGKFTMSSSFKFRLSVLRRSLVRSRDREKERAEINVAN